jgi:hypothetical protein
MGTAIRTLDGGNDYYLDFMVKETIAAAQALVREATATAIGEVADPASTTAAADFIGCAAHAVTFNATPTVDVNYPRILSNYSLENLVRVLVNPMTIWRFPISGGATAGTALQPSTATPANILVNDTADASGPDLITDTAVGTVNMEGGLIKGRTGNNAQSIRKQNAHTNSTSVAVGVDFLYAIEVGASFIRVPYSRHIINAQFTSDFTEMNGIIATGTGAPFAVVNVHIDEQRDQAWVDVVSRDHFYSPESA